MDKNEIIKKIYYDEDDGYGSINKTFQDAKKIDKEITYNDVKKWFDNNIGSKHQLRGFNSFVVDGPYIEYQLDLFFFMDLEKETGVKQPPAIICVDIFSKYTAVVPLKSKKPDDVLDGIKELFKIMQSKPDNIFTDAEGSFLSNLVQNYLKEENIKHIMTRTHPAFAERCIRTIKSMIYRRTNGADKPKWTDYIKKVLEVYNHKMVHSSTGFTPDEGRLARNRTTIKQRLLHRANYTRKYPDIAVNDKVKVYKKKDKLDKERKLIWSDEIFTVEKIETVDNQKLYKLKGVEKPFIRSEIYLLNTN